MCRRCPPHPIAPITPRLEPASAFCGVDRPRRQPCIRASRPVFPEERPVARAASFPIISMVFGIAVRVPNPAIAV